MNKKRRQKREQRLRAIGFEDVSSSQRKANLQINVALIKR